MKRATAEPVVEQRGGVLVYWPYGRPEDLHDRPQHREQAWGPFPMSDATWTEPVERHGRIVPRATDTPVDRAFMHRDGGGDYTFTRQRLTRGIEPRELLWCETDRWSIPGQAWDALLPALTAMVHGERITTPVVAPLPGLVLYSVCRLGDREVLVPLGTPELLVLTQRGSAASIVRADGLRQADGSLHLQTRGPVCELEIDEWRRVIEAMV